jgi:hypothetical protein
MQLQDSTTYTALKLTLAAITAPTKGTTLTGYSATFKWTAENGSPTGYRLWIGSTPGASDIAALTPTSTSVTASSLPADGRTLYVTLYGNGGGGGNYLTQDTATYTAANITKSVITAPAKGSKLPGATVTFTWSAETGATSYQLYIGKSPGAKDITSITTSSLSTTYTKMPVTGIPIYVTLYGNGGGGTMLVQDTATYTAFK